MSFGVILDVIFESFLLLSFISSLFLPFSALFLTFYSLFPLPFQRFDSDRSLHSSLTKIPSVLRVAIGICQRNTPSMDAVQAQSMWFSLLDLFIETQQGMSGDKYMGLGEATRGALEDGTILKKEYVV